jgi:hypothetical protein
MEQQRERLGRNRNALTTAPQLEASRIELEVLKSPDHRRSPPSIRPVGAAPSARVQMFLVAGVPQ